MTYNARETSADQGSPIELFEFVRGVQRWRYTSADKSIAWNGNTYASTAIARSAIEVGQEIGRQGLRITAARDLGIVDLYRGAPPTEPILVTIWQTHEGDPDAQFVVVWQGRILAVEFQGPTGEIMCESVFTSLRRSGLRRAWQRTCPHPLYSAECRVSKPSYQTNAVLSVVSGNTITASAFAAQPTGYFLGGFIEWITPNAVTERRMVTAHAAGGVLTLDRAIAGLAAGETVAAFPGCDHTTGADGCARFSNILNFGGTPYIPTKNPFTGDPVF